MKFPQPIQRAGDEEGLDLVAAHIEISRSPSRILHAVLPLVLIHGIAVELKQPVSVPREVGGHPIKDDTDVIAVQQIEGWFLSPHLMAGATGLHPVYVVLLLSAGGLLLGLTGMVIILPLFLCLRGAGRILYETRERKM